MQGDVSFTFLDRIEEVELNIVDGRWQSALALALTCQIFAEVLLSRKLLNIIEMAGLCWIGKRIRPVMWEPSIFADLMNMQGTTLNYLNPVKSHIFAENAVGSFDVNIFIKIKDF